jgi:hypothetical protein
MRLASFAGLFELGDLLAHLAPRLAHEVRGSSIGFFSQRLLAKQPGSMVPSGMWLELTMA